MRVLVADTIAVLGGMVNSIHEYHGEKDKQLILTTDHGSLHISLDLLPDARVGDKVQITVWLRPPDGLPEAA